MKFLKLFIIVSCLVSASFSKEAKSADFYVDQSDPFCADDGSALTFCTINAAITSTSDGDSVFIGEGNYSETNIDVTTFINISGAGIDKTVIDATGGYGLNFFLPSPDPARNLNLTGVSIKNASDAAIFATDVSLYIKSSSFENPGNYWTILSQNTVSDTYNLIIEDSTFENNHGEFYGSAITAENINLIINRTGFRGNNSVLGGTIYAKNGKVTLIDSLMSSNISDTGAAIYQDGGELTILGTTFDNNSATTSGGVLFLNDSIKLNISDSSTFSNNSASAYSVFYKDSGTTAIDSSTFSQNTSTSGPALYQNLSTGTESSMIISKSIFDNNETANGGASAVLAVYGSALVRSTLEINDSTFDTNSNLGDDSAGDFVKAGVVDVGCYTNTTIKMSTFYNNTGKNGGALYIDKCDVDGDGISETLGVARVVNSTFSKNITTENGGAIYNDGILILENVTLAENESISASGGGIYDPDSVNTSIHNSILAGNIAPVGPDCNSSLHSEGYNIVTDTTDCTLTNSDPNVLATDFLNQDPNLDLLQNNGGNTETYSLSPGSIALNAGNNCIDENGNTLTISQNNLERPQGASCDIGALEGGCGDGVVQSDFAEECDDENIVSGDGCDNTCKIEAATTTSEDTTSGDTSSGDTSSGDTTSGDTTSGDTTAGDSTSGDTSSGDSTAGDTTSGDTTSGDTTGVDGSSAGDTSSGSDTGSSTGGVAEDNDGDGFNSDVDCNDSDATINPDSTDNTTDGIDQDCSGADFTLTNNGSKGSGCSLNISE